MILGAEQDEHGQARFDLIRRAFDRYIQCMGIVGAEQEAWEELRRLREHKSTWSGRDQLDLLYAIWSAEMDRA